MEREFFGLGREGRVKYPGFGIYNRIDITYKADPTKKHYVTASIKELEAEELGKFEMGYCYEGAYPKNSFTQFDDTKTLFVDDPSGTHRENIVGIKKPYYYKTTHQLVNQIDYPTLQRVIEEAGFTVGGGWYTDHNNDTLYPHDVEIDPSVCKKTKVVVVAKKEKN